MYLLMPAAVALMCLTYLFVLWVGDQDELGGSGR